VVTSVPPIDPLLTAALEVGIPVHDLPSRFDPSRIVTVDGTLNVRDLGGIDTADGRSVRRGLLVRSDHLNEVTELGLDQMRALNLRYVYDFRLPIERERQPSRLPETVKVELLATGDLSTAEAMIAKIPAMLSGAEPIAPATWWDDNYIDMLDRAQPMFVALVRSLTDPSDSVSAVPGTSAMFHCTGGKDRTGMAAALILGVLGVTDDDIVDDFLTTNVLRTPKRLPVWQPQFEAAGIAISDALPILGVTRSGITTALTHIAQQGGAEAYLIDGGVEPAAINRLRALLVD
jgi:protein-tyrosine phosphatase